MEEETDLTFASALARLTERVANDEQIAKQCVIHIGSNTNAKPVPCSETVIEAFVSEWIRNDFHRAVCPEWTNEQWAIWFTTLAKRFPSTRQRQLMFDTIVQIGSRMKLLLQAETRDSSAVPLHGVNTWYRDGTLSMEERVGIRVSRKQIAPKRSHHAVEHGIWWIQFCTAPMEQVLDHSPLVLTPNGVRMSATPHPRLANVPMIIHQWKSVDDVATSSQTTKDQKSNQPGSSRSSSSSPTIQPATTTEAGPVDLSERYFDEWKADVKEQAVPPMTIRATKEGEGPKCPTCGESKYYRAHLEQKRANDEQASVVWECTNPAVCKNKRQDQ